MRLARETCCLASGVCNQHIGVGPLSRQVRYLGRPPSQVQTLRPTVANQVRQKYTKCVTCHYNWGLKDRISNMTGRADEARRSALLTTHFQMQANFPMFAPIAAKRHTPTLHKAEAQNRIIFQLEQLPRQLTLRPVKMTSPLQRLCGNDCRIRPRYSSTRTDQPSMLHAWIYGSFAMTIKPAIVCSVAKHPNC